MQKYFIVGKDGNNYVLYSIENKKLAVISGENKESNNKELAGLGFDFYNGTYIGDRRGIEMCAGTLVSYDSEKDIYGVVQYNSSKKKVTLKYFVDTTIEDLRANAIANTYNIENIYDAHKENVDITTEYCKIYKRFPCSTTNIMSRERYIKWIENRKNGNIDTNNTESKGEYKDNYSNETNKQETENNNDKTRVEDKSAHCNEDNEYRVYGKILEVMQPYDIISIPVNVYKSYRTLSIRNLETTMDMSEYTSIVKIRFSRESDEHVVAICIFSEKSEYIKVIKVRTVSRHEITDSEISEIVNKYRIWKKQQFIGE